jgi:hypothetical protein
VFKTYGLRLIISTVTGVISCYLLHNVFVQGGVPDLWVLPLTLLGGLGSAVYIYWWYDYCKRGR